MHIFQRLSGCISAAILIGLILTQAAAAQVNSTVSGTVEDTHKALIPGVTITATNIQTGVETKTISNDTGSYNFPALVPGTYRIKAELMGFNTKTVSSIELAAGLSFRQNFVLDIAATGTSEAECCKLLEPYRRNHLHCLEVTR